MVAEFLALRRNSYMILKAGRTVEVVRRGSYGVIGYGASELVFTLAHRPCPFNLTTLSGSTPVRGKG